MLDDSVVDEIPFETTEAEVTGKLPSDDPVVVNPTAKELVEEETVAVDIISGVELPVKITEPSLIDEKVMTST